MRSCLCKVLSSYLSLQQSSVPKIQRPVPDIQISEVDGGGENRRLTGADVIRGVTNGCHVEQRCPNGAVVNGKSGLDHHINYLFVIKLQSDVKIY